MKSGVSPQNYENTSGKHQFGQGRLVMKAKKAAAYPASSVCFIIFIINIFILDSFRIAVVTSN